MLVATAAVVVIVLALASGGGSPEPTTPTTPTTPTVPPAQGVSESEVRSVLSRYEDAFGAEDLNALDALFAPGFERQNDGEPAQSRSDALAEYADQFDQLSNATYRLTGVSITTDSDSARATASYSIDSDSGTVTGSIAFDMARSGGDLQITRIVANPDQAPTPSDPGQDPGGPGQPREPGGSGQYSQTVVIKAWYSTWSYSTYIHFKAVDEESGTTVAEASGSDSIDLEEESGAAARTPERERLVAQLQRKLEADGWTAIGTLDGGEWYQLRFGR